MIRLSQSLRERLPRWTKPRLSEAKPQYRPRPLTVPARYAQVRPPQPAPGISIVTPCLNDVAFVAEAVESVLGQKYPNLEYVLMDGGSSDGSVEVIERYHERLHGVRSGPDQGQANAINRGFELTSGEIMAWLNSNDLLLPGTLPYVARYFQSHPEVDLVYGHRIIIDADGNDTGMWITPRHRDESLIWFDYLPQETAFWRRQVWDSVGGLDQSIRVAFDWDFFLRAQSVARRVVRLPRFLGAFRLHDTQKTASRRGEAQRELAQIRDRWHGRPVTLDEAKSRVDHFRARSLVLYGANRLIRQLPGRRIQVPSGAGSEAELGSEG